ncbi:periplasmic divalent cation tolerance protein [Azospirillum lipoferum]|uniref:Divalent-cation tolerance protein CutA n=1 Tax=Azospirillum lipoferum TaxID=193 RepID=A0A5A9GSF2_AZOLI|nr:MULTISPECIES: divalent-cation tolerance protein CutA [Azospirillum]KAA0597283.1 divalent-cation tolerance protein CutA [Azospirillum lipoferum]MCP1608804.1 periplasmic divalent cation tolerance protein [Azospirillum lipoferum]MDW5535881.1 divalent-cation tolerance protein CutA [Azospirillum sp. NL1]
MPETNPDDSKDDLVFAYITAASKEEALRIGRSLVEERLAACANVLDGMTSVYRWNGAVEQAEEAVLIAKTRSSLFDRLTVRVRELHSFDTPCVVELALGRGNPAYLDWLRVETA